jgi:hypothetical protein
VDRIKPGARYDAKVWLDDDAEKQRFEPPEGWAIDNVFIGSNGSTCLRLSRDGGDA